jgi:hypothetical protein
MVIQKLNTRSQAEITLYIHKIPGRNNPLSQYLNTRSQAKITIYAGILCLGTEINGYFCL